jgi:perosamine synthetase
MERIFVAQPKLAGNERKYVLDCLDTNWVSSIGKYIGQFEEAFAKFCGVKHAIATNNGTTALHVALVALGLKASDEVIVPTVTYVATANAVRYCRATPVLVDVCPETMNIDPVDIERKLTPRTRGIIAVHLYGHPADMNAVNTIAQRHGLWVVEDAAEAHGAEIAGKRVGGLGDCAMFSFFGNKIVTTGEGGMVTTDNHDLAGRVRILRGQGMDPSRRYWFPIVGYNYRMTNIQAAIGLAQLERVDEAIRQRDLIASWYGHALSDLSDKIVLPARACWAKQVFWMYNIFLRGADEHTRDSVMRQLDDHGIETRPVFYPMHIMPPYEASYASFPVADNWHRRGITLPNHEGLSQADVERIATSLHSILKQQ